MHNVTKMVRHTLKFLQQMLQDFESVSDHYALYRHATFPDCPGIPDSQWKNNFSPD